MTKKIPEGFNTVTPTLVLDGAADAIALYQAAFGATVDYKTEMPDSKKIMHACITIGTSKLFLSDVNPGCGAPSQSNFYLYFEDVDAAYKKATAAGLDGTMPPTDMFWGDRMGALKDKFGTNWTVATHVRDVSPEAIEEGKKQFGKAA